MDTLLFGNDDAALIGNDSAEVRIEVRPSELPVEEWEKHLRSEYGEPEHWYRNEDGVPFSHFTGGYWYENGRMFLEVIDGITPYKNFSDEATTLSVRAVFDPDINNWVVADMDPEPKSNDQ
jgi:hypothetical protein